jgi:ketosteroid isomerase-like protein
MAEHPNTASLRAAHEAWARGDMQAMADLIHEDVVWHEIGNPEPVRGRAAVASRAGGSEFQITGSVHDILASDDHGVALVNAVARRGDRTLEYRTAEIYHLREGKIVERWAFSDDTAAIVAFFA